MSADTHVGRLSVDSRQSTVDRYSIDSRSTVDRQLTECRSSIDRLLTATSTDIAVDIIYSKHDPFFSNTQTKDGVFPWNNKAVFHFVFRRLLHVHMLVSME